jgi:hypothetical protein
MTWQSLASWWAHNWQFVPGYLAFPVSLTLAAREFWRSRSRIHFSVDHYVGAQSANQIVLVTANMGVGDGGVSLIVIHVYNRGRDPLHLAEVGLRAKSTGLLWRTPGGRIVFQQSPGLPGLPARLEPSDGFLMASRADSFSRSPGQLGSSLASIRGPYCRDGAGREYKRRFNRRERQRLGHALGPTRSGSP